MANLTVSGVKKSFGGRVALNGVDLSLMDGELCVIVGPSGSGKSTLLRAIAGLETVDAGTISFNGEPVNDLRPRDRNVAMVSQQPVLFPHLTVYGNIAFGLRARRVSRTEMIPRVERVADALGIADLLGRRPRDLTDGERQCVAVAHAVVRDALVFLFDEPLARLDLVRREALRAALKRLHQEKPMTAVYATQDPMEALNIGDRIVLMRDGKVEQEGAPIDLFERPASRFVAGFFGPLKMNFLPGIVARSKGGEAIRLAGGELSVALPPGRLADDVADGRPVILGLRPEHMMRAVRFSPSDGMLRHEAEIELLQPAGPRIRATFRLGGESVVAELQAHDVSAAGETVTIDINLKRASIFDAETEEALLASGTGGPPRDAGVAATSLESADHDQSGVPGDKPDAPEEATDGEGISAAKAPDEPVELANREESAKSEDAADRAEDDGAKNGPGRGAADDESELDKSDEVEPAELPKV